MPDNNFYRVLFYQDDEMFEVYAKSLSEDSLMGFIEIEELILSDPNNTVIIDPSEERLHSEFKGVQRCYIPMHNIIRIDVVKERGIARIKDAVTKGTNVSTFPRKVQRSD